MRFRDFHRNVILRIGLSFLSGTANNMVLPFMSIYFSGKLGDTSAGLVVILGILAGVISGIIGGYYADRIGRKKLMLTAEIGWMLCFMGMALSNSPWLESPWMTFVLMILVSMFWGIHGPANEAMLLDVTAPDVRKFMYAIHHVLDEQFIICYCWASGCFFIQILLVRAVHWLVRDWLDHSNRDLFLY